MALLTNDMQEKLMALLTEEGLVTEDILRTAEDDAAKTNKPLLAVLAEQGTVDEELLTHAIAQVSGVPYVNLSNSNIDKEVLALLPEDIAERFMAVPLAEVQNRLAVAMIDANNVQAVDYLANLIQRPSVPKAKLKSNSLSFIRICCWSWSRMAKISDSTAGSSSGL